MAVTCTRKFSFPFTDADGEPRTALYFPGQVIEDADAAAFAKMTGHAEDRAAQEPPRNLESPERAVKTLEKSGGETKETKAERKAREKAERAARGVQPDEGEGDKSDGEQGGEE